MEEIMNKKYFKTILTAVVVLVCLSTFQAFAELPELLPRQAFFGGQAKFAAKISPDGKYLAYMAPSNEGIFNVWIKTRDSGQKKEDQMVTQDKTSGIYDFYWAYDNKHILFLQDSDGDENFHVYAADIENKTTKDMTPFKEVKSQNLLLDENHPHEILVGLNKRDKRHFDMHRINLETGKVVKETENPGDVRWWLADADFVVRAAVALNPTDISTSLRVRDGVGKPWRDLIVWPFGETGLLEGYGSEIAVAFTPDGNALYVQAAFEGDHTQLAKVDAKTGKVLEIIAQQPNASIWNQPDITLYDKAAVMFQPKTMKVQAVGFYYLQPQWQVLDPAIKEDFEILKKIRQGIFYVVSRDLSGQLWTVNYYSDNTTGAYYLYDSSSKKAELLFETAPHLAKYTFAHMKPEVIKSRDGADIPCYLTLPEGIEAKNLPMVLLIHGGPWARDGWGFDAITQLLANRGYAVLQVNYRASTGFGKKHLNAGNGQWGVGHMQNDVTDAAKWFIEKGVADPKRIAIMGASYGGYATLAGLTFTPDLYTCGIALSGPANMKTNVEAMPEWWYLIKQRWLRRMGNVLEDDELNRRISPYYHADKIKAKLLIFHGVNDPRVKIEESNQIVNAMRKNKKEVIYVVYPNEGHGISRPENFMDALGRIEEFLAKYLGGRAEPWQKIPGCSAELR
jgi:dipeptidyl aminopeptidase/acylaminoacyl peptidase